MASILDQTFSIESVPRTTRTSLYKEPPAQSGSVGSGSLGVPGTEALVHRVSTLASLIRTRASFTATSKDVRPAAEGGINSLIFDGAATTSCLRLSTSLRASRYGTGVTSPTQPLESLGVRTGIGIIILLFSPAAAA